MAYATDRRLVASGGKIALAGRSALNPESVASSGPAIAGKATFSYTIAWCSPENDRVRELLEDAGYYWTRGGPTHPYAGRYRHYLKVDGKSADGADARVRHIIEEGGADSSDLTVMRQDPDRLRFLDEVIARAWTEAEAA